LFIFFYGRKKAQNSQKEIPLSDPMGEGRVSVSSLVPLARFCGDFS
jgi:hypothetical protein